MKTWAELTDHERIQRQAAGEEFLFWMTLLALVIAIIALTLAVVAVT